MTTSWFELVRTAVTEICSVSKLTVGTATTSVPVPPPWTMGSDVAVYATDGDDETEI
jgi:hypothetical protein